MNNENFSELSLTKFLLFKRVRVGLSRYYNWNFFLNFGGTVELTVGKSVVTYCELRARIGRKDSLTGKNPTNEEKSSTKEEE
ncbi:uncharacterized protein Gasu_53980 [Galdieria sulphuraria]|uniref:Uncharacterized protein n=1 Tax=Galdieria sulphuraria TaxID=130081 RepID=M2XUG3_GALSU|nr:uncharacterized protein Gasu_53980 [Galdieria sulphuraria]EME27064.1 hypothetical protein Gasu_53980 [Galdieria sulphuraria]|eukprot:XP_005703584.1 hypothetical protein Gasu_53980 [Galdieria sulphuraria]